MKYNKIQKAKFISRPNRFITFVDIDGVEEKVHVKNTGRCRELLIPGVDIILEDASHVKTRKTRYSLIAVYKENMLINMDSQVPNKAVFQGLENNMIGGLTNLDLIKNEKTYKNSRFDIYFEKGNSKGFIEVKGVTLENDGISMFPDAPTSRGSKHALELVDAVKNGYEGYIIFLIQMKGPTLFKINKEMDPEFYKAILYAHDNGVKILAFDSIVTEDDIILNKEIKVSLD